MRRSVLAAMAVLLALGGCTGTQEGEETVLLVIATESAIGLAHHVQTGTSGLEWLPDSVDDLSAFDDVVDMAVARHAGPDENDVRVELLYREGGGDYLQSYDATFVPPDEAARFAPLGAPTNLSTDVVAPSGEVTEGLCTTAFDVSPDGRWLALLHEPAACGTAGAEDALLVVDREGEEDLRVVNQDVAALRFAPTSDELVYVDDFLDVVVSMSLPSGARADLVADPPADLTPVIDLSPGPTGRLSVAGSDAVAMIDPEGDDAVEAQDSLPGLEAVLDSDLPEDDTITVRTATRLAVHPDPLAEIDDGEDAYCASSLRGPIADAVVGPFSFAYVLVENRLEVFDLYACDPEDTAGSILRPDPVLSADVLSGAVAVDWIFGASRDPDAAP